MLYVTAQTDSIYTRGNGFVLAVVEMRTIRVLTRLVISVRLLLIRGHFFLSMTHISQNLKSLQIEALRWVELDVFVKALDHKITIVQ